MFQFRLLSLTMLLSLSAALRRHHSTPRVRGAVLSSAMLQRVGAVGARGLSALLPSLADGTSRSPALKRRCDVAASISAAKEDAPVVISGMVKNVVFRKPGYSVLKLKLPAKHQKADGGSTTLLTVCSRNGCLDGAQVGETLEVSGRIVKDKMYGEQLVALSVTSGAPRTT